jgi:hypothetical protein
MIERAPQYVHSESTVINKRFRQMEYSLNKREQTMTDNDSGEAFKILFGQMNHAFRSTLFESIRTRFSESIFII